MAAPDGRTGSAAVTVAISTRERPEALARCLDSLFAGTVLPREVVIVDQSPREQEGRIPEAPGSVRLVHVRQSRTGLAVAQNEAVRRASAPVVAVIDDDCVAAPDWLGEIEMTFASEPSLDLVGGRVLPAKGDEPDLYPVSLRVGEERLDFEGKTPPWLLGSGNNFAVRRERFLAVGGCDERLGPGSPGLGAMDMDLFYRLMRAGARARYEPSILVYHERKTASERHRRRFDYGYGMGACCRIWLAAGDRYAIRMLLAWTWLRLGLLRNNVRSGDRRGVREELLVLAATARGLLFSPGKAKTKTGVA